MTLSLGGTLGLGAQSVCGIAAGCISRAAALAKHLRWKDQHEASVGIAVH